MSETSLSNRRQTNSNGLFANWRQNIIYIGFVVIFLVFAAKLSEN